jgi:hypothetical protein
MQVLTDVILVASGRHTTMFCLLLCSRQGFDKITDARDVRDELLAQKGAAHKQRMAKVEATVAAKKRKYDEVMERIRNMDPAHKRTRRGRGLGPRQRQQQENQEEAPAGASNDSSVTRRMVSWSFKFSHAGNSCGVMPCWPCSCSASAPQPAWPHCSFFDTAAHLPFTGLSQSLLPPSLLHIHAADWDPVFDHPYLQPSAQVQANPYAAAAATASATASATTAPQDSMGSIILGPKDPSLEQDAGTGADSADSRPSLDKLLLQDGGRT